MGARARYNAIACPKFPLTGGLSPFTGSWPATVRSAEHQGHRDGSASDLAQSWATGFAEVQAAVGLAFIPARSDRSNRRAMSRHGLVRMLPTGCGGTFHHQVD